MGKSTISMAIFNSYVSLPEGKIAVFINLATLAATPPAPSTPESERNRAGLLTHFQDLHDMNLETITPA
jgi:hypothetical protein